MFITIKKKLGFEDLTSKLTKRRLIFVLDLDA